MRLVRIPAQRDEAWQERLADLEAGAVYPLGEDSFRIDHGRDYFAFFRRLGEVHAWAAMDGEKVAAMGCGVLRRVPVRGGGVRRAWYLCDLKVQPAYRGRHLPLWMLNRLFLPHYLRCARGYGISMDPAGGENRVVRIIQRFPLARRSHCGGLLIYSLDLEQMRAAAPALTQARGALRYLSLGGVKDLVLGSTGTPMPLWHVQFGQLAGAGEGEGEASPREGGVHMFCHPSGDALGAELAALGLRPSAQASLLQHRMTDLDWSAVLTSEI